jgi:hypothetical protein
MSDTLQWFTSSYSNPNGGDCVEVAFAWHKSSYSSGSGGNCVEVAACSRAVHVRDSKNPDGGSFAVGPAAWTAFLAGATTP